jgi:nitrate reductase gamma subunit
MCDFVGGHLVSIAFIVFILGVIYQGMQFFKLTKKKEWARPPLPVNTTAGVKSKKRMGMDWIVHGLRALKGTLWETDPLLAVVTSIFHVFIIGVPLFLLGHNILLDQSWGLSLFSLPESLSDFLTVIVLICGAYFLGRRLFLARVRAISSIYDYVILLIAVAPFLTGFLAYHQWWDYKTVIFFHILSGEIMLFTIPFTKLGHMLFFFLYRFFIGSEYSFVRGSRTW